ncbi:MAG: LacI family DNA-binding transcriptional regulator [Spirochaetia bacterium]|jgi:DNA-binding LacI/PurR family transcriptional regulator
MAVTRLQDVAGKAGVSLATASLALAGKGRISAAVRLRVQEAAGALGYRVKPVPQARADGGGARVGILHADDRDYEWNFIRPTMMELEHAMHQREYAPVTIPVSAKTSGEHLAKLVAAAGVSAVFALHFAHEKVFHQLEAHGVPVVVINNSQFQDRFFSVCVDDFQGACEGALALISRGHRSIAFVEYERPEKPVVVADRYIGFRKALDENCVPFSPEQRITVPFMDERRLEKKLEALFLRSHRPTAIFAHDDYLGLFVIAALGKLGLAVPDDVSLVAPGDVLDYSLPLMPQITTMRINTMLLGRIAANLMFERMKNGHEEVHVLKVKEQLVMRESCRKLQEGKP